MGLTQLSQFVADGYGAQDLLTLLCAIFRSGRRGSFHIPPHPCENQSEPSSAYISSPIPLHYFELDDIAGQTRKFQVRIV